MHQTGGQNYYVACDNLDSTKTISDSNGTIIKVLEYDSYGRLIVDSNPDFTIAIGYAGGLDEKNVLIRFSGECFCLMRKEWDKWNQIGVRF